MKKLDEIPKKNPFEVPEGYFDRLPGIIQSRVSDARPSATGAFAWSRPLRYAIPIALIAVAGFFWFRYDQESNLRVDVGKGLAAIQSDQLAAYLDDHEMSTDDLVETVTWSSDDIDELENTVYSNLDLSAHQLEEILNDYDEL